MKKQTFTMPVYDIEANKFKAIPVSEYITKFMNGFVSSAMTDTCIRELGYQSSASFARLKLGIPHTRTTEYKRLINTISNELQRNRYAASVTFEYDGMTLSATRSVGNCTIFLKLVEQKREAA